MRPSSLLFLFALLLAAVLARADLLEAERADEAALLTRVEEKEAAGLEGALEEGAEHGLEEGAELDESLEEGADEASEADEADEAGDAADQAREAAEGVRFAAESSERAEGKGRSDQAWGWGGWGRRRVVHHHVHRPQPVRRVEQRRAAPAPARQQHRVFNRQPQRAPQRAPQRQAQPQRQQPQRQQQQPQRAPNRNNNNINKAAVRIGLSPQAIAMLEGMKRKARTKLSELEKMDWTDKFREIQKRRQAAELIVLDKLHAVRRELKRFRDDFKGKQGEVERKHRKTVSAVPPAGNDNEVKSLKRQIESQDSQFLDLARKAAEHWRKEHEAAVEVADLYHKELDKAGASATTASLKELVALHDQEKQVAEKRRKDSEQLVAKATKAHKTLKAAAESARKRKAAAKDKRVKDLAALRAKYAGSELETYDPSDKAAELALNRTTTMRKMLDQKQEEKKGLNSKLTAIKERLVKLKALADKKAAEVAAQKERARQLIAQLKAMASDELPGRLEKATDTSNKEETEARTTAEKGKDLQAQLAKAQQEAKVAHEQLEKLRAAANKLLAEAGVKRAKADKLREEARRKSGVAAAVLEQEKREAAEASKNLQEKAAKEKADAEATAKKNAELAEKAKKEAAEKIEAEKRKAELAARLAALSASKASAELENMEQEIANLKAEINSLQKDKEDVDSRAATEKLHSVNVEKELREMEERVHRAKNKSGDTSRALEGSLKAAEHEGKMKRAELERTKQKAAALAKDQAEAADAEKKLNQAAEAQQKAMNKLAADTDKALQQARDLRVMVKRAAVLVGAKDPEHLGPMQAVADLAQDLDVGLTTVEGDRKLLVAELADSKAQQKKAQTKKMWLKKEIALMKKRLEASKKMTEEFGDKEHQEEQATAEGSVDSKTPASLRKLKELAKGLKESLQEVEGVLDETREARRPKPKPKKKSKGKGKSEDAKKQADNKNAPAAADSDSAAAEDDASKKSKKPMKTKPARLLGAGQKVTPIEVDSDEEVLKASKVGKGGNNKKQWKMVEETSADVVGQKAEAEAGKPGAAGNNSTTAAAAKK